MNTQAHEGRAPERQVADIQESAKDVVGADRYIDTPRSGILPAKPLRGAIRELASDITSRAVEIEAGRRIPPDLVEALCTSFDLPTVEPIAQAVIARRGLADRVTTAAENLIDDRRRENVFGLLVSLSMLIEFGDAFDFTGADFRSWCSEMGFRRFPVLPLGGPASAAIAYK